jgi:hypothetical protein
MGNTRLVNLWLVLAAWIGVSLPVSLFLGGCLAKTRDDKPDFAVLRDKISPTQLA